MSEETNQPVDLEAFAKKVAEETAAKIAMKQAEQKAAEVAVQKDLEDQATANAEAKVQQEKEVKQAVATAVESGAERLLKDIDSKVAEKDAQIDEIMKQHESDLKEKSDEIAKMRDSKRVFSNRGSSEMTTDQKQELVYGSILGKITRKGWDTDYGKSTLEKAGVDYTATTAAGIDVIVSTTFEEEVRQAQKVAPLFRELAVASGSTVVPIAPDTELASWNATGLETAGNALVDSGGGDTNYSVGKVTLTAHRLISGTYISNDVDEQVVVTMLPVITSALARAHARAIDSAIMIGTASFKGLVGGAGVDGAGSPYADDSSVVADLNNNGAVPLTGAMLMNLRAAMGKYGLSPEQVVYIVNNEEYFSLISDPEFLDVNLVGNDRAAKLTGGVGSVYGSPVVVTDAISRATGTTAAVAVAHANFVIPRLKGISIETDYEVSRQSTAVVAAQSLGFGELVNGTSAVRAEYT